MRTFAYCLSLVLVFTIPWENAITVGEIGTLTRVIGVLAAVTWLFSVPHNGGFRKLHPFHMVAFLFIMFNIASFYWSSLGDETMQQIKTYIQLGFLSWILWDLYTTPRALTAALLAYILGAYITIGSTISNYLVGQEIAVYEEGRFAGSNLNANDLALILALGLPVAWHLAISAGNSIKDHVVRIVNYVYIPASLFAITLTATRTAFFTVLPAFLYFIGTAKRLKPLSRILISAVIVGALFFAQPHIPKPTLERLASTTDAITKRDLSGREELWSASTTVFLEHPLLGVGSGALGKFIMGAAAHNSFLSVLAELGLIGFILFVTILAIVVYQAVKQPSLLSRLWLAVFAIWAIGACSLTWEYRKPTWLFLSLIVISASLSHECTETQCRSIEIKQPTQSKSLGNLRES